MWQKCQVSPVPHPPGITRWSALKMKKKIIMTERKVSSWLPPWQSIQLHTSEQKPWWLNTFFWTSKDFTDIYSLPILFHSQWTGTLSFSWRCQIMAPGKSTRITGHLIQTCALRNRILASWNSTVKALNEETCCASVLIRETNTFTFIFKNSKGERVKHYLSHFYLLYRKIGTVALHC